MRYLKIFSQFKSFNVVNNGGFRWGLPRVLRIPRWQSDAGKIRPMPVLLGKIWLLQKYKLNLADYVHICQMSPQVRFGNPSQIWMRYLIWNQHFDQNLRVGEIMERRKLFCNPFPWAVLICLQCVKQSNNRVESMFAPSQWETALLCNDVSQWLGASLESAL